MRLCAAAVAGEIRDMHATLPRLDDDVPRIRPGPSRAFGAAVRSRHGRPFLAAIAPRREDRGDLVLSLLRLKVGRIGGIEQVVARGDRHLSVRTMPTTFSASHPAALESQGSAVRGYARSAGRQSTGLSSCSASPFASRPARRLAMRADAACYLLYAAG